MTDSNGGKLIFPTIAGIALALAGPLLYVLLIGPLWVHPATVPTVSALIGFAVYWVLALCLLAITRFAENKPLSSLGLRCFSWQMVAVAVGLGILLSVSVPLLTLLASQIFPVSESGGIVDTATSYPGWLILLSIVTAGVTEEILFRGYAIERLLELTGNAWLSALISLAAFVLAHGSGWSLSHILGVVLPLGVILTGLYLWRRNLVFVIIIHILVDLPLFFIALGQ